MSDPQDIEGPRPPGSPDDPTGTGSSSSDEPQASQAQRDATSEAGATEVWEAAYSDGGDPPSNVQDPLIGKLLRDKWRVLERIGAGSFGTVYRVRDEKGGWIEALKILSVERLAGSEAESMRMRFLREAQIMKRLGLVSPHIVALSTYEEDIEAGLIYFLMEHVEGRSLSRVLRDEGPLNPGRVINIALQACDALIAAHESPEPVVHRDLKLENLMITRDTAGRELVKVLDFGIASLMEQDPDSRLTAAGTLGTPGYAAPEQIRAGNVDGRTDLFALGVVMYSLLTGRDPWIGHPATEPTTQTYQLMAATDRGQILPLEEHALGVPPGLSEVVKRLLQRKPSNRYQSARELKGILEEVGAVVGIDDGSGHLDSRTGGGTSSNASLGVGSRGLGTGSRGLGAGQGTAGSGGGRRLAAVWFADLVGYSSLSSIDEDAALTLLETFHATARQVIASGGGRLVQFIGDAAFAEFGSTERAVRTAMQFRRAFAEATRDHDNQPQLRIGVHVGDVLMGSDGDLFGDGVNVASRIQSEAEPGEILVSQDVWRQLKQRRDFGFVSMGERKLKGISAPLWLFAVNEELVGQGTPTPIRLGEPQTPPRRVARLLPTVAAYIAASAAIVAMVELLVLRVGLAAWVVPAALGLLGVGLVVILVTAWFQTRPTWERSVGEVAPWALDVPDLITSVKSRKLPELTWARAVVGGLVAFALLFGVAGGYLILQQPTAVGQVRSMGESTSGGGASAGGDQRERTTSSVASGAFEEGERLFLLGDLQGAVSALERATGADTEFAAARARLALAHLASDVDGEAAGEAERALSLMSRLTTLEQSLTEVVSAIAAGSTEATALAERARDSYPDDPYALLLLGIALERSGEEPRAGDAYEEALEAAPGFGPAYGRLVSLALEQGNAGEARRLVEQLRGESGETALTVSLDAILAGSTGSAPSAPVSPVGGGTELAPRGGTDPANAGALAEMESLLQALAARRATSDATIPEALRPRLTAIDTELTAARQEAEEGRVAAALQEVRGLTERYDALLVDSRGLASVVAARQRLDPLRSSASDPGLVSQAAGLERRADQLVERGMYQEALAALGDAAEMLRRAAEPSQASVDAAEPPPPPPAPADVASETLGVLARAIESEQMAAVRAVWTSMTGEEVQGMQGLFDSVSELTVTYDLRSAEERGDRVITNVHTTYTFLPDQTGRSVSTEIDQVFELGRVDGRWVVVASSTR